MYGDRREGIAIVGTEPSCILTLRDEYRDMLPNNKDVQALASQAFMIDEFLAKLDKAGELGIGWKNDAGPSVLFHGHCQQKALVGTVPTQKTLTLPDGYQAAEVDASCCGMAGAFGYETEHYDISMKMGERRLFPEIRAAAEDAILVASGTSCRHQIEDGTGKKALHPAQVLHQAMARDEQET